MVKSASGTDGDRPLGYASKRTRPSFSKTVIRWPIAALNSVPGLSEAWRFKCGVAIGLDRVQARHETGVATPAPRR